MRYSGRSIALLIILAAYISSGYGASEVGESAYQKLAEGQKLSTLTSEEKTHALEFIRDNYRARKGLLRQIEAREADAAMLDDLQFQKALNQPDLSDSFVLSFGDKESTFSRYNARFELEVEGALIAGFGGPCNIYYSVRPHTAPPTKVEFTVRHSPGLVRFEDSVPGNTEFEVFRLSQTALDNGSTITSSSYEPSTGIAKATLRLNCDWKPKKEILGEFIVRGLKPGSGIVEFLKNTSAYGSIDGDGKKTDTLFTSSSFDVVF